MSTPPAGRASRTRKQSPTFQLDAHELYRLNALFPPAAPSAPIPQIIQFEAHQACSHARGQSCQRCLTTRSQEIFDSTFGDTETVVSRPSSTVPERSLEIVGPAQLQNRYHFPYAFVYAHEPSIDALSWWPSLSNSRCTESISLRGVQGGPVSRGLFQAIVDDHTSLEALSALVKTCDYITTPHFDRDERSTEILRQKHRVFSLLRTRLESGESASDQVIMTMFFLLTLDLFDDTARMTYTWDVHLHAIQQIIQDSRGTGALAFWAHFRNRTESYIEYLEWMKTKDTNPSEDNSVERERIDYPPQPLPLEVVNIISSMPSGFAAIAKTALLSLDTIELIQKSCELDASFTSQVSRRDRDDSNGLVALTKETNFRCNDLLLHRKLGRVEEIIVLGLASHCHYLAQNIVIPSSYSAIGLGISPLLCKLSCTFHSRQYELLTASDLISPPINDAMAWAGSMLVATSPEDQPTWAFGQRLLRLCKSSPDKVDFIWPQILLEPQRIVTAAPESDCCG